MQRRVVPRTDPRYNQVRARNNDSVKKSRDKSRRERDETVEAINQLEQENEELTERIRKINQEYEQLQELFKQHTGIAIDELISSDPKSISTPPIQPKPVEQPKENLSQPVLTINTTDDTIGSDNQLDPSTLDGAIVLINGVQYKIMNSFVYILFNLLFTFLILVISEEPPTNDHIKRKKQDFYCSACKSMSETIFREINSLNPNERVQVGSYRVDGHGHQKLKDVPISETRFHAEDVLESVCSKFANNDHDVIPKQLKNIYEHACDDILEEHHDSLIDLLVTQNKHIQTSRQLAELLCIQTYQYCQIDQLDELFFKPLSTPSPPIDEEKNEL